MMLLSSSKPSASTSSSSPVSTVVERSRWSSCLRVYAHIIKPVKRKLDGSMTLIELSILGPPGIIERHHLVRQAFTNSDPPEPH